jgi:hypothetical protein
MWDAEGRGGFFFTTKTTKNHKGIIKTFINRKGAKSTKAQFFYHEGHKESRRTERYSILDFELRIVDCISDFL